MDWNYKMFINGVYWKGFGGKPTLIQREVESGSFKRSEYYKGGDVKINIVKS